MIRPATPDDRDALAAILTEWLENTEWLPNLHTPEQNTRFLGRLIENMTVLVFDDGVPLGFVAGSWGEVDQLYVAQDHRNKGVGAALIKAVQATMPEIQLWCFVANTSAMRFYERMGFREHYRTAGDGNDENLPDIRYIWQAPS